LLFVLAVFLLCDNFLKIYLLRKMDFGCMSPNEHQNQNTNILAPERERRGKGRHSSSGVSKWSHKDLAHKLDSHSVLRPSIRFEIELLRTGV
jgi:hypothetical protein